MKMRNWKKYVCLAGISLLMSSNLYASRTGDGEMGATPVKKTRSATFVSGDKAWEPAGTGVTRQIMGYDGQVMLVKVKFEKGAIGTPHTHYHTQTTYVASGKFEFTVGDEKKVVKAGDGIYIEPDVLHGCVCLEPGILIDCFAPMRADFLK